MLKIVEILYYTISNTSNKPYSQKSNQINIFLYSTWLVKMQRSKSVAFRFYKAYKLLQYHTCLRIYKIHTACVWISFSTSVDTNRAVSCLTASLLSSPHPLSAGHESTEGFDQHVNKLNTSVRWVKADSSSLTGEILAGGCEITRWRHLNASNLDTFCSYSTGFLMLFMSERTRFL